MTTETLDLDSLRCDVLRWTIGTPDGRRGSVWRFWTNKKGDAYLAVRSLGGAVKVSFHRDRRCHVGFTSEYAEKAKARFGDRGTRLWDRWEIPRTTKVRVIQVVLPESELRTHDDGAEQPDDVRWLAPPPADHVSVVSILVVPASMSMEWTPQLNAEPVAALVAGSRTFWVLHGSNPINADSSRLIEEERKSLMQRRGADALRGKNVRAAIWVKRKDHERYFIELAWT
jgi:hypothetical protein